MATTSSEKYLWDILTANAKIDENIKMRYDKGMGNINQFISILKEISFGIYHFEIGMMLRTSMPSFLAQKPYSISPLNT